VDATHEQSVGRRERKMMSRAEAKQFLISCGIEEPTEEQVTNYLNSVQNEVKKAEDTAKRYKADADKVKDLEKQIEEMNTANMTDLEKANKATQDALNQVEEMRKTVTQMQLEKSLAEIGIVGDDASGLFSEDGQLNTEKLGKIIESREKAAVATFQKDALDKTPSPNGNKGGEEDGGEDDKPYKDIVDRVTASKKAETDAVSIIDAYK